MGFEVFDDVAFYYLLQSLLAVTLFPSTIYILWSACAKKVDEQEGTIKLAKASGYGDGIRKVDASESFLDKYCKKRYALFVLGWILFMYLASQVDNYNDMELASFKPYDILGLEPDASEAQIKRSYRKLAVKYHPDKCKEEECNTKFIQVSKAYNTLTDPVAQENMKLYGNPDGKQGMSMTIGLPSFLMAKENALKILLVYFLTMIIVPPVLVYMWWSNKKRFAESGVMHHTLQFYVQHITEHMSSKFLIEILAVSQEYAILGERNNTQAAEQERKKLLALVKEDMVKPKFKQVYCQRANLLLHAYLLRVPIPPMFDEDLRIILEPAHRLLTSMRGICLWRRYFKAATGCIELSQLISQAMFFAQDPLYQLPYMTERDLRNSQMKKLKMDSIDGIRKASKEQRQKALERTAAEWEEINNVLDQLPNVSLAEKHEVKDEEGIYEGDVITITVTMNRLSPEEETKCGTSGRDLEKTIDTDDTDDDAPALKDDDDEEVESFDSDDVDEEANEREAALLEQMPVVEKKKKQKGPGRLAHCPLFPFPKHEEWTIFLMKAHKKSKTLRLFDAKKVSSFHDMAEVEFFIKLDDAGTEHFELHAKCDSFVGCDRSLPFKITVEKMSKAQRDKIAKKIANNKKIGLDDEAEEYQEEEPKWYFLYQTSLFEMILNIIVFGMLAFFVYNFLHQRGYWQKYCDPPIQRLMVHVNPLLKAAEPVTVPLGKLAWKIFKIMVPDGEGGDDDDIVHDEM